jgi:hypothetical protein
VLDTIYASGLPVSASYGSVKSRGYTQLVKQIIECLHISEATYVFFCEHDVLYNNTHFAFTPTRDDIFYYNTNVWRWDYPEERYITYDRLISLSGLCVNRLLALDHYRQRLEFLERGGDGDRLCRKMGYEPGTKKKKRGGFSDDDFETFHSAEPLIDVRHSNTFSPRKVQLSDFTHPPKNWKEVYARP